MNRMPLMDNKVLGKRIALARTAKRAIGGLELTDEILRPLYRRLGGMHQPGRPRGRAKYCPDCGRDLPFSAFHLDASGRPYASYCKAHHRARIKARAATRRARKAVAS
jgi:hypothetical protein